MEPIDLKIYGDYFWTRRSPEDLECTSGDLRGGHEAGGAPTPLGAPSTLIYLLEDEQELSLGMLDTSPTYL